MKTSLRDQRNAAKPDEKRQSLMNEIKEDYKEHGEHQVTPVNQRNVMLIGRTRTGKSTIKSLLVDPTVVPDDLALKSGTRVPLFESFHVKDKDIVLNIIDTPGLFEHSSNQVDIRDNKAILQTIQLCVNREITKFHVICFCISITTGINETDIESLKLLVNFLGNGISGNSCLIVTRCESKGEKQRATIQLELKQNSYFKDIVKYFQLGILFSGSINPDDHNGGNESIRDQYVTVSEYREKLIDMFTRDIQPFPITETLLSEIRVALSAVDMKEAQIQVLQNKVSEQDRLINKLQNSLQGSDKETTRIRAELTDMHVRLSAQQPSGEKSGGCTLS